MSKTYEALYENGQIKWLTDKPDIKTARIIITILEETAPPQRRTPPAAIAGKAKTIGDLIAPIVPEADWECLNDDRP